MSNELLLMDLELNHNTFSLLENFEILQVNALPKLISFSPLISFKIQRSQENCCYVIVQMISMNKRSFQVKDAHKNIFIKELQTVCRQKMGKVNLEHFLFEKVSLNNVNLTVKKQQNLSDLCQFQIIFQNNRPKIKFWQMQNPKEIIKIVERDMLKNIIFFLKIISRSLINLFQRIGTIKPSFSERLKNNLKIEKQKRFLKKIVRERKDIQKSEIFPQMVNQMNQNKNGIFKSIEVIKQQKLNQDQIIFKRGGYFNVEKKKFLVKNYQNSENSLQIKLVAQKRLNKRKRPNTIFNYEGKILKEIRFLQFLNNLSKVELHNFAQYYFLKKSLYFINTENTMLDQSQTCSKDSLSTVSQERSVLQNQSDVIYMKYYDQNLQEYLTRKGKLEISEIIHLLKQIFQSVIILHSVGIVHRDIKPANFMVQHNNDGTIQTKIIDFGQSTHTSMTYDENQILGFSTKYAPIQCTYTCKEGYNFKQIDLWSVGVVIYQLTTNRMPVSYSKCFKSDIKMGWPTDLNFFVTQFIRGRWQISSYLLITMAVLFMKVKPQERLNLKLGLKLLDRIERVIKQFSQQQIFQLK